MSTHRKKKDVSKLLPRTFHLFGIEADFEAIQFSYVSDVTKTLTDQLLNQRNKISAVEI